MSLDRKILERIERENLGIRPKWFFAMKNMFFGTGTLLLSVLGSLSLALLFEIIKQQGESITWFSVPYIWAIMLGVFLMAGYWMVINIDSLYRIKFVPIVSVLFFISLSFGYLTFASGKAEKIELELEKISVYDEIIPIKKDASLNAIEKAESNNENTNINDESKKNNDDIKEDNKSVDIDEDDKIDIQDVNSEVEIKEENEDDKIKESEKTDNISKEDEDLEDAARGEVKGASKEVVKNEDEETGKVDEEKSDSDDRNSSSNEDSLEESEPNVSSDTADED